MQTCHAALATLDESQQKRAIQWLASNFGVVINEAAPRTDSTGSTDTVGGIQGQILSPKEFMTKKKPETAVERIACLGYYLVTYKNMKEFQSKDLIALNLQAAGRKFSNPSRDFDNADRTSGFLVTAGARKKQMSARGDALVSALPDREAVKLALKEHPIRRKKASPGKKSSSSKSTK